MCKCCKKLHDSEWDFCYTCYQLKKQGKVLLTRNGWQRLQEYQEAVPDPIYSRYTRLITNTERQYFDAIKAALPDSYHVFPQVGLSAVVRKNVSESQYRGELFRVLDFVVTDKDYAPLLAIEVNDSTHASKERWQRDQTLKDICGEAGLGLVMFRTDQTYPGTDDFRHQLEAGIEATKSGRHKPYVYKTVDLPKPDLAPPQPTVESVASTPAVDESPAAKLSLSAYDLDKKSTIAWSSMLCLTFFLGWSGVHRFYAGRIGLGVLYYLLLLVLLQFASDYAVLIIIGWWVSDFILVITGHYTDKDGYRIQKGVPH